MEPPDLGRDAEDVIFLERERATGFGGPFEAERRRDLEFLACE